MWPINSFRILSSFTKMQMIGPHREGRINDFVSHFSQLVKDPVVTSRHSDEEIPENGSNRTFEHPDILTITAVTELSGGIRLQVPP